jgi:D-tyrosyl-tRNA(Tyr) deacylase
MLYLYEKNDMRALIQKVRTASVTVQGEKISSIGPGLLVFLGIESEDTSDDISWLARKIAHLRIFQDHPTQKEQSVIDQKGEILVVSQFTLHASTKKGNRPSYIRAARPEQAEPMYESMMEALNHYLPGKIHGGKFGAMMDVDLVNNGPMTIWMDSKARE